MASLSSAAREKKRQKFSRRRRACPRRASGSTRRRNARARRECRRADRIPGKYRPRPIRFRFANLPDRRQSSPAADRRPSRRARDRAVFGRQNPERPYPLPCRRPCANSCLRRGERGAHAREFSCHREKHKAWNARCTKVTYSERPRRWKMEVSDWYRAPLVIMPQKLMDVLMLGHCSHEFSWPRRAASGEYYQVCMLCATAYQYDWKTMRRGTGSTNRRRRPPPCDAAPVRSPTWMPRARRLRSNSGSLPRKKSQHLVSGHDSEHQPVGRTVSWARSNLPANALVELIFEMPEEISGQKNSNVLCQGRLIRTKDAVDNAEDAFGLAASILDYKFLAQRLILLSATPKSENLTTVSTDVHRARRLPQASAAARVLWRCRKRSCPRVLIPPAARWERLRF
jgi:hypothetical protein